MSTKSTENAIQREGRLVLAIDAYNKGQFRSVRATAAAFHVSAKTLQRRLRGSGTHQSAQQNTRNLTATEETTLTKWILDLAERGHPVRFYHIEYMANQLLSAHRGASSKVGTNWTQRFVNRNPAIRAQRYRKYDYEGALCEDPKKINEWFALVQKSIQKNGTLSCDI